METNLVSSSVSEVLIDFSLHCKCRSTVSLTSLCASSVVAFKVQTSSPTKFLVNPPTGLIPPLSTITFQIVLKPQNQLPEAYPRSHHDRFLVRAAKITETLTQRQSIAAWMEEQKDGKTQDLKLKVAFVGPVLLQHAVSRGAIATVKKLIKRRDAVLDGLPPNSLPRQEKNGFNKVKVLSESSSGDANPRNQTNSTYEELEKEEEEAVLTAARRGECQKLKSLLTQGASPSFSDQYGLTALHVAALKGHKEVVEILLDHEGVDIEWRDGEGHTPLHLAVEGGNPETVAVIISRGADINSTTTAGATPLYIARTMGYDAIARMLDKQDTFLRILLVERGEICDEVGG